MLIYACVTDDFDIIDGCGFPLVHTHFKINGVILYVHFYRLYIEEQISSVRIEFADGVVIPCQTVIESFEIIHVSWFDSQCGIQIFIGIDGISHPFD